MVDFFKNIFLFTLIFFLFDRSFLLVANYSAKQEVDKRLELLINGKINKDLIVLGSSRGARDIIAQRLSDKTGLSAYNLSYPGGEIEFQEFIMTTLIKFNKIPKAVILTIDYPTEFLQPKNVKFRTDRLYPLIKYDYIVSELVKRKEKNELLARVSILHRLNKRNFDLTKKKFTPLDTILSCGSMPISINRIGYEWKANVKSQNYSIKNEIGIKVNSFQKIIKICKENKIKLIIVFPPNYDSYNKLFEFRIRNLVDSNGIFYIYNLNNPIYHNKDYFYDYSHLKLNGAEIYTDELANFIRSQIR
jgi:hypothetical protein